MAQTEKGHGNGVIESSRLTESWHLCVLKQFFVFVVLELISR